MTVNSRNFYLDNPDLQFQVENIDLDQLWPLLEMDPSHPDALKSAQEAREQYRELLENLGEYIAQQIAPFAHELDEQKPTLKDGEVQDAPRMRAFIDGLREMGATGLPLPRHVGGLNVPWVISSAYSEMLARADVSLMTYQNFFAGIGLALQLYAFEEGSITIEDGKVTGTRFDEQMRTMASGETCGSMVLTEPQAGSDLSQIHAKAELSEDGKWRITGQKIWITCGHGEHQLVLARSEDPKTHPDLKGLSLFYVPAHKTVNGQKMRNVEIGGLEKKMGQNSSVTVTLNYDNSEAELIGQRGHGFRYMLLLMNNARLLVGVEGLGICEAAHRMAQAYAKERVTMGKPIEKHEMIAEYLDDMELMIKGLRALNFDAAFHEELASRKRVLLKVRPPQAEEQRADLEREIRMHKRKARMSTPLVKYLGGELAVDMARMTMQIMGGVGYMKEYKAEKLLRDALVLPIYEGTSQIQSLMALKDHLQHAMRNPMQFLDGAKMRLAAITSSDKLEASLARLKAHYFSAVNVIIKQIVIDKFGDLKGKPILSWKSSFLKDWDPKRDFSFGMLHAERFTKIAAYVAIAKVLVKQAKATKKERIKAERLLLAERFIEMCEPKCRGLLLEIEAKRPIFYDKTLSKRQRDTTTNA